MATAIGTDREIVVEDIGPVERVVIPIPAAGGVVELRGANGIGKSTALAAIQSVITGESNNDITVRRGAARGTVEAFGVTLRLGKRTTTAGELEVESIESRLDLSKVVDPGLKDPAKADAQRLRALVGLIDLSPEVLVKRLSALLPDGQFDRLVSATDVTDCEGDLLAIAVRAKKRIDDAALKEERAGEDLLGKAKVLTDRIDGINLVAESDSATLQAELTAAVAAHVALKSRAEAADKCARVEEQARAHLAQAEGDATVLSVSEAESRERAAIAEYEAASSRAAELREALKVAELDEANARSKVFRARDAIEESRRHERLIEQWRRQANAERVARPSQDELDRARKHEDACRAAVEEGQRIRDAKKDEADAAAARAAAKERLRQGSLLRDAARSIDGVLSDIVREAGLPVAVRGDRLYLGDKLYGELSHGQRWRPVLEMAAKASKAGGLFHIPQEAWEGLQPRTKKEVAQWCKELGVTVYTARCSDDEEIVAEVL